MAKFLLVGNALIDIVAKIPSPTTIEIDSKTVEKILCINFASKTELEDLQIQFGGSAANTAITTIALGSRASILTAVGGDNFGKMVQADLRKHGVDTSGVITIAKHHTGMSVVLLAGGEKSVLTYHGAFAHLSPKHLNEKAFRDCDVAIFTSLSSKENFEFFKKAVAACKKLGKKMVFAPSITMLKARAQEFKKFHEHFEIATMNREEAAFYTGKTDPLKAIKLLPGKVKVITDGANGAYAHFQGETFYIPTAAGKICDATGAGDAFTGAFCHEYYSHGSVKEALRTATAVAALKLETLGAHFRKKMLEVDKFKKKNASKLVVRKVS